MVPDLVFRLYVYNCGILRQEVNLGIGPFMRLIRRFMCIYLN